MTLVINEVHALNGLDETWLIAAADSRISNYDHNGVLRDYGIQRKLLALPYLKGAISFYGLAEVKQKVPMSTWLGQFINKNHDAKDLEEFSKRLRNAVQQLMPKSILERHHSGFHICGHNANGHPDFWHVCNHLSLECSVLD